MRGMYICREDYDTYQTNKTLPQEFIDEYCDKILDETFNPFFPNETNGKHQPDDIFLADEIIDNSYHLNKNYKYFLPSFTIHLNKSPEELDFKQIIESLPPKMKIIWIEKGSTFLTIAFVASGLYEAEEEFQEAIKKLNSAIGQFIIENFNEIKINFPNEDDVKNFFDVNSHNIIQNVDILNKINFNDVKNKVIEKFNNLPNNEQYINYIFKEENIALFEAAEKEVRREIKENSIEFIITGETIIANKYLEDYNEIKKLFLDENLGFVECFLFHGSRLNNHPRIVSRNFTTPYDDDYVQSNDPGYFGKGIYATDNLFYASMYSNDGKHFLQYGDKVSVFCCRAIYNKMLCITDPFKKNSEFSLLPGNEIPGILTQNCGIYKVLVGDKNGFNKINEKDRIKNMVVANEFVFTRSEQIIPISSFTIMRTDHFILWIDTEKNKINEHKNELKILRSKVKVNIYYAESIDNAINLMKNKRFNIMKLILSVSDKNSCIKILGEANKIFGSRYTCFNYQKTFQLSNQMINVFDTDKFEYVLKFAGIDLIYSQIDELIDSMDKDGRVSFNIDIKQLKKVFEDSGEETEKSKNQ